MSNIETIEFFKVFCNQWEMMSDLSMSHEKISDFVSFLLFWFILVIKLRNFEYEINWNTLIFFDKKCMVSDLGLL